MKHKDYSLGGWVDERIAREWISRMVSEEGIDPEPFCDWLAVEIGKYRIERGIAKDMPSLSEEVKVLRDFQKAIEAALHYLTPGGLGPRAGAMMTDAWFKLKKEILFNHADPTVTKLRYLKTIAENAERELSTVKQKPGTKRDPHRLRLLAAVTDRFKDAGVKAAPASRLAAAILEGCGLDRMPDRKEPLRRAVKKGTQLAKKNG